MLHSVPLKKLLFLLLLRRGIGDSIAVLEEQIAMISVALDKLE